MLGNATTKKNRNISLTAFLTGVRKLVFDVFTVNCENMRKVYKFRELFI